MTLLLLHALYVVLWQHLLDPHILDAMHCEKNFCENVVKTMFGMKDSPGSRLDAEELGIRQEIWLQPPRRQNDEYYMPHAPFIMTANERNQFVAIVSKIRTPTNYVGSIHKRLVDGKLQYMKTHDYHVLMQQVTLQLPFIIFLVDMCLMWLCYRRRTARRLECRLRRSYGPCHIEYQISNCIVEGAVVILWV